MSENAGEATADLLKEMVGELRHLRQRVEQLEADTDLICQQLMNTELDLEKQKENASFGWSMFHEVLEERNEAHDKMECLQNENGIQAEKMYNMLNTSIGHVLSLTSHCFCQGSHHLAAQTHTCSVAYPLH